MAFGKSKVISINTKHCERNMFARKEEPKQDSVVEQQEMISAPGKAIFDPVKNTLNSEKLQHLKVTMQSCGISFLHIAYSLLQTHEIKI